MPLLCVPWIDFPAWDSYNENSNVRGGHSVHEGFSMNSNYDAQLETLDFYKLHPSYLPFVGKDYGKYRILQISESHYLRGMDTSKYGIAYFEKWFEDPCEDVERQLGRMTRGVCEDVIARGTSYCNFDNPLRSFRRVVLGQDDPIDNEARKDYDYFAFMNFYQFPAFEEKGYFSNTVLSQGKREGQISRARALLSKSQAFSTRLVDEVIRVLDPRLIVFTSSDASDSYKSNNGLYADDKRVIFVSHPNNPFPWSKPYARYGGKRPVDVFEEKLREVYQE